MEHRVHTREFDAAFVRDNENLSEKNEKRLNSVSFLSEVLCSIFFSARHHSEAFKGA